MIWRASSAMCWAPTRTTFHPSSANSIANFAKQGPVLDVGCGGGKKFAKLPAGFVPYGIEIEAMVRGHLEHVEMHMWIFVASEPYVTNLARLLRFEKSLHSAVLGEDAVRILEPDVLVKDGDAIDVNVLGLYELH